MNFLIFLIILSLVDIGITYFFVRKIKQVKKFRKIWFNTEGNPLLRYFWKKFGLEVGTLITAPITTFLLIGYYYWMGATEFMKGLIIGMYIVVYISNVHKLFYYKL